MTTLQEDSVKSDYRADITGLRAIAVLSVLFFHFKFNGFQGGFVGVDIFFVISGYLITRQILDSARKGQFSYLDFYTRRMSRILPALIFTVVVTFICGALWLSPELLRQLAKESTHALLSISNIQYWREANEYFAPRSEQLGLLHFWSLSLEEQFYIVWPAFIVVSLRFVSPVVAIGLATICSFALAVIWSSKDPQAVFFLMPFRIFEFGIGALVLFAETHRIQNKNVIDALYLSSLVAIAFSVVYLNPSAPYLGCLVLIPSLGAAALIYTGATSRLGPYIANKLFVGIGAISYSLYLCHWPILFFARFIFGDATETVTATAIMLTTTFVVGNAMYLFVEQPFRHGHKRPDRSHARTAAIYFAIIAPLAIITHTAFLQQGWSWRLPSGQAEIAKLQSFGMAPCEPFGRRQCAFGAVDKPIGVELVGDSYIQQYVAAIDPILKKLEMRGETSTLGGCPILIGVRLNGARSAECLAKRNEIFSRLQETSTPVIIGFAWHGFIDGQIVPENSASTPSGDDDHAGRLQRSLEATVRELSKNERRILIVGAQVLNDCKIDRARLLPGPLWHAPLKECAPITKQDAINRGARINSILQAVAKKWPDRVTFLQPVDHLCDTTCAIAIDGIWLYQDDGHFTIAGSRFMGSRANDVLVNFLKAKT